jgi:hypothetical protein
MTRAAKATIVAVLVGGPLGVGAVRVAMAADATVGCVPAGEERPYVCDVGEPRPLSLQSFNQIFQIDNAVRATVARIGMPDYAEIQKVGVEEPWVNYELRTYYKDYNRMLVFGRAMILGNPQVSLLRHEGPIPPDKLAMLTARVVAVSTSASDAARRAEEAAALAEDEAARAERYADSSESAANSLDRSFREKLVKQ